MQPGYAPSADSPERVWRGVEWLKALGLILQYPGYPSHGYKDTINVEIRTTLKLSGPFMSCHSAWPLLVLVTQSFTFDLVGKGEYVAHRDVLSTINTTGYDCSTPFDL